MVHEGLKPWAWLSRRELREKVHSVWLVKRQERVLIQIKPDAATQHAQFALVSYYCLSVRLGQPVTQQRMLRHLGIEMWVNLD